MGFGDLREHPIAFEKETAHVPLKKDEFGCSAQQTQRRAKLEQIGHLGLFLINRVERVTVAEGLESPRDHLVFKAGWAIKVGDFGREALPEPKVAGLPSHGLAHFEQSVQAPPNRSFACFGGRNEMDIHAPGKIEDALAGCSDMR